jgi:hypothetical protein
VIRKLTVVILASAALALIGCGGSQKASTAPELGTADTTSGVAAAPTPKPHESAGDAVKRQMGYLSRRQWGREWDELNPGQQAIVPREKYVDCASATNANLTGLSIDVIETYDDPMDIIGVPEKTSTAVTIKMTTDAIKNAETTTVHEVLVAGEWRWILSNDAMSEFQAGNCPSN